jgi:hypothetical protein
MNMEAVQKESLTDVNPEELLAVDGGNPALVAGALLAGAGAMGMGAAAGTAVGLAIGTAIKYARDAAKDEKDESVPVAPAT